MILKWIKTDHKITKDGSTTTYAAEGTSITIESRKRHLPRANGVGTWDHTSFFILRDGAEYCEAYTLKAAKEKAEKMVEAET